LATETGISDLSAESFLFLYIFENNHGSSSSRL
jgi:hypothetical protein